MGLLKQARLFNEDEELVIGLQRAKNSWLSRRYADSIWKATNEERRTHNVNTIQSLLDFQARNGKLTQGQRELAKRLIDNANKK